ncbi:protein transport protein sft2 [Maniola jurtina]|uniref:protein transport protein sft2 n=1 Tax=Maniola jurtina TaxID=191418 RepID=UPI001E68E94C|nr:protein transport protein sft2 [Maniola jurtina]
MANLKSDLDEYLLQNESRRSYKISLPFSTPSFFSRSNEETPTSSTSSTGTWFENVQKEYFTLSRTQRFMGFGICLSLGVLCFILSFLYIPFLLLQARKFALLFTLGSVFFIFSFSFLYGPWAHMKSLFSKERAITTLLYGFTLVATLYCALHLQSTALTIICAVAQVLALMWMMLGSIPGGSSGARVFGSMFKSSVSNTLPI